MTHPQTPSLPPNFALGNYRITGLIESGDDFHLYHALTPEGQDIQLREFCPQGIVSRDMLSGNLTVLDNAQEKFDQAQAEFLTKYAEDAESKQSGLGSVFFVYTDTEHFHSHTPAEEEPVKPEEPVVAHARSLRPTANTAPSPFKAPLTPATPALGARKIATSVNPAARITPAAGARKLGTPVTPATPVTPVAPRKVAATPGATLGAQINRNTPAAAAKLSAGVPATGRPITPMAPAKKSGGFPVAPVAIIGLLCVGGFLLYQVTKDGAPTPVVTPVEKPAIAVTPKKVVTKPTVTEKTAPVVEDNTDEPEDVVDTPIAANDEPVKEETIDLSTEQNVKEMEESIRKEAIASQGKFSAALLQKFPVYAEAYVRDYVKKRGGSFSANFETWLKKTNSNREIFGMFYPVDPSVATNAAILVDELGLETAEKYSQLVIAFAIGRREFGMGAFDLGHQGRYLDAEGKLKELRKSGVMPIPADLYCAGKAPVNWYGNTPGILDEDIYQKVEAYIDENQLTPKQAWEKKYSVATAVAKDGFTEDKVVPYIYEYMYRHGQLKRKRDPFPTPAEFLAYLVNKYETCSRMRDVDRKRVEWSGLSPDGTPWPALLALSETRPLRECDSVWERYRGERGENRVWTYGPYRADDDENPPISYSFDPDGEWAKESNERQLHVGGVCGTMSLIARNSEIARGIPSAPAGQPGHGNLMTTHFTRSGCWLSVGQSVDTLKATTGYWYLRDSQAMRTGNAEYQAGLALSMNLDYENFLSSRNAMNIFKLAGGVSGAEAENTAGPVSKEMVRHAMQEILRYNPFYTEAWYTLYKQQPHDLVNAMKMVYEIRTALPDGMGLRKLWGKRKYASSVARDNKDKDHLANQTKEYVNVLCSVVMEEALKQEHGYTTQQWQDLLTWIKKERKDNTYPEPQAIYRLTYANAQGPDSLKRTVDRGFKLAVNFYRNKKNALKAPDKIDQQDMAFSLDALSKTLPKEEMTAYLKEMLDTCPQYFMYLPKNGKETKIQVFFDSLAKNYDALADTAEKDRLKEMKKQASDLVLEQYNKGQEAKKEKSKRRRRG